MHPIIIAATKIPTFKVDILKFTKEDIPRTFTVDPKGFKIGKPDSYVRFRFNTTNGEKIPNAEVFLRYQVAVIAMRRLKKTKPGYSLTVERTSILAERLPKNVTEAWITKQAKIVNAEIKSVLAEMRNMVRGVSSAAKPPSKAAPTSLPKTKATKHVEKSIPLKLEPWLLKDGKQRPIYIAENKSTSGPWTIVKISGNDLTITDGKTQRVIRKWLLQYPTFGHSTVYGEAAPGNEYLVYETATEGYKTPKEAAVYKLVAEAGEQYVLTMTPESIKKWVTYLNSRFFLMTGDTAGVHILRSKDSFVAGTTGYKSTWILYHPSDKIGWPYADPQKVSVTLQDIASVLKKIGLVETKAEDWEYTTVRPRGAPMSLLWTHK